MTFIDAAAAGPPHHTDAVVAAAVEDSRGDDAGDGGLALLAPLVDPAFLSFVSENGRTPALGDDPPPFSYKGWLLWQAITLGHHPDVASRWPYWLEAMSAGRLPRRPIPRIDFAAGGAARGPAAQLRKLVEELGHEHGHGERALYALIGWLAFGLSVSDIPPDISAGMQAWLYGNFDLTPLLLKPCDALGALLEEYRAKSAGRKPAGFFLTPTNICGAMAELTLADAPGDRRALRVHDPAVGSGRQLIMAADTTLRLTGQDVDPVCCLVALVNAALYAPSVAFPLPQSVFDAAETEALDERPAQDAAPPDAPRRESESRDAPDAQPAPQPPPSQQAQSTLFDLFV